MKKALASIALALLLAATLTAQERNFASGFGGEVNNNSEKGAAGGVVMASDFTFKKLPIAVGLSLALSTSGKGNGVLEPTGMFRWYFLGKRDGIFLQGDLGLVCIKDESKGKAFTDFLPLAGLRAGYRLNFLEAVYVEPYGRVGIPFIWGLGLMVGLRYQ